MWKIFIARGTTWKAYNICPELKPKDSIIRNNLWRLLQYFTENNAEECG
jgi:hypothetical protein